MTEDEIPPEWIWHLEDELNSHFEEVDRQRKERSGEGGSDGPPPEMMDNELAEEFRR